jgi:hypothetical protein
MLNLPSAGDVPAGGSDESPVTGYRSLSDELAPLRETEMLTCVNNLA